MKMLGWVMDLELALPMAKVKMLRWVMDLVLLGVQELVGVQVLLTSALEWAMEWAMGKCQRFYLVVATAVVFFHEERVPTH